MSGRSTRTAPAVLAGAVIASVAFGSAATLGGVTARELSSGTSTVASCDSDGVGISYTVTTGTVTDVTITGVAAGCAGGALKVVLANSAGASVGAGGPVTVAGTSVAVTLSPQPSAASVAAAHISITGP